MSYINVQSLLNIGIGDRIVGYWLVSRG